MATNITDDKQKRAMLLYQVGTETQEIFETFQDTGDDYATAKAKLNEYFYQKKTLTLRYSSSVKRFNRLVKQ